MLKCGTAETDLNTHVNCIIDQMMHMVYIMNTDLIFVAILSMSLLYFISLHTCMNGLLVD